MKIGIAVAETVINDEGEFEGFTNQQVLYEWKDAEEYNRKAKDEKIEKGFFNTIKLLEKSKVLENEIKKFRKMFAIPDNLDFVKYEDNKYYFIDKKDNENIKQSIKYSEEEFCFFQNVQANFNMPEWLKDFLSLESLFYTNTVYAVNTNINFLLEKSRYSPDTVAIYINSSEIKKNTLITYIEKNWKNIETEIAKLPPMKNYFLSKRDERIVELRNEGKTYRQITDIIAEECKDKDSNFDEATIKTAYLRAKKSISSVFEKNNAGIKFYYNKARRLAMKQTEHKTT